ncbi:MAG: diguanylate cyclase [Arcobacteraceae bacterium]
MENISIELEELKTIYNYVTEAIIISDETNNIVLMNKAALQKFEIEEDEAILKTLEDFIPIDERETVLGTIKDNDISYYDVMLKKLNSKLFPAFISGQVLKYQEKNYGILTVVDVTDLKNKEKAQLKKLKSHIITQATSYAQKENEMKGQETSELMQMREEVEKIKHENFMLERKVTLFERENKILNTQSEKIQEDSFSFEQILDREMALAKRYDRKFSLAIIAIDNFKDLTEQLKTEAKRDLVVKAFKKHFRSTIRTTDVIYYENSGLFYLILPNSSDVNITDLVARLLHAKKIDTKIVVRFNCGLAHYYDNDTRDHLMYRARKSLEVNIEENNFVKSR